MLGIIGSILANEPVMISTFVGAVFGVLIAFNVPVTEQQQSTVIALVVSIGALLGAFIARSQVTPTSKLNSNSSSTSTGAPTTPTSTSS